jgi:CubicO group peptidase (beta-lactamase class C family)
MRGVLKGIASRRRRWRGTVAWVALGAAACSGPSARVATDAGDGEQVATRIRQVEQGLLPAVVIDGRPLPVMTLEERMRTFNVPGVSIAVVNAGRIEWAKGYGMARAGGNRAVDSMTLFQAASIRKPVAALGALELVEQGRLALDEDVNIRLTSWRVPASEIAGGERVTLRRLVSHNAGLTVHGFPGYARGVAVPSAVQVLDGVPPANTAPVRIDLLPGSRWRYSGGGFTVVQQLMSDVAGRPFAAVMEELVLRPLGMTSSTYVQPLPEALADRAAHAHTRQGQPIAGDWHTYPEQAAAGLWTTPSDLARMILAVQRASAGAPNALLSQATAREMLSVQAGDYGLGFGLDGEDADRVFSHGGSNAGFRALFVGFVEAGRGAVVMTNADLGGALIEEIMRAIAQAYDWPMYRPESRTLAAIDSSTLPALTGRYRLESSGGPDRMLEVSLDGGRLRAMLPNWVAPRTLYAIGPARFFMLESPTELTFESDAAGRVVAVLLSGGGQNTRLARIE